MLRCVRDGVSVHLGRTDGVLESCHAETLRNMEVHCIPASTTRNAAVHWRLGIACKFKNPLYQSPKKMEEVTQNMSVALAVSSKRSTRGHVHREK